MPIIAPIDVPLMQSTFTPASSKACKKPRCTYPLADPPHNATPSFIPSPFKGFAERVSTLSTSCPIMEKSIESIVANKINRFIFLFILFYFKNIVKCINLNYYIPHFTTSYTGHWSASDNCLQASSEFNV